MASPLVHAPVAMPGRMTALLRQPPTHPGGNIDFLKKDEVWLARAKAQYGGPDADLIGHYHTANRTLRMEIAPHRQGIALVITAIPPRVSPASVNSPAV